MQRTGSLRYVTVLALVAALGGLLFGYDTAVINGAIGFLQQHFDLNEQEEGWATASALLGCALGAATAGILSDRLGRKRALLLAAVCFFVSALGTALPRTFLEFIIYRILGGLGIGIASLTSPLYIAEISPARIRGRLVSVNQLTIVLGMMIVFFVNYFIAAYGTTVDRRAIEQYQAEKGDRLDRQLVFQYLRQLAEKQSFRAQKISIGTTQQFVAEQGDVLQVEKVADFLVQHGIKVDTQQLELGLRGMTSWNQTRGWRWMFGSEALPAGALLLLLFLVPESPRFLAQQGRSQAAWEVLARVGGAEQAAIELADIEQTIAQESGSLRQLLEPGIRPIFFVGIALAMLQQVSGINVILYYGTELFKQAGSQIDAALLQNAVVGTVNVLFTIVAIWTVDRWGRRPLMLLGSTGMGVCLIAVGIAYFLQQAETWLLALVLGYIACFALSVGPVTWVILSEIFPTRIRGRAMAFATVALWIANFLVIQTFPIINKHPWLVEKFHCAFPFWVYAAFCAVLFVVVWRIVPETKGKTLEQIERGWLAAGR